jgi:hypothetical protein
MSKPLPSSSATHQAHPSDGLPAVPALGDQRAASLATATERMRELARYLGRMAAAQDMRASILPAPPATTEPSK